MLLTFGVFPLIVSIQLVVILMTGFSLYVPSYLLEKRLGATKTTTTTKPATTEPEPDTTTISTTTTEPTTTTTMAPLFTTCTATCGTCVNVTTTNGIILSRNYPNDYGTTASTCIYSITVTPGKKVKLVFTVFNVEIGFDFVTVFNGPTTSSPAFFTKTGYSLPPNTTTSSNKMIVRFTTDNIQDPNLFPVGNTVARWAADYFLV